MFCGRTKGFCHSRAFGGAGIGASGRAGACRASGGGAGNFSGTFVFVEWTNSSINRAFVARAGGGAGGVACGRAGGCRAGGGGTPEAGARYGSGRADGCRAGGSVAGARNGRAGGCRAGGGTSKASARNGRADGCRAGGSRTVEVGNRVGSGRATGCRTGGEDETKSCRGSPCVCRGRPCACRRSPCACGRFKDSFEFYRWTRSRLVCQISPVSGSFDSLSCKFLTNGVHIKKPKQFTHFKHFYCKILILKLLRLAIPTLSNVTFSNVTFSNVTLSDKNVDYH